MYARTNDVLEPIKFVPAYPTVVALFPIPTHNTSMNCEGRRQNFEGRWQIVKSDC